MADGDDEEPKQLEVRVTELENAVKQLTDRVEKLEKLTSFPSYPCCGLPYPCCGMGGWYPCCGGYPCCGMGACGCRQCSGCGR